MFHVPEMTACVRDDIVSFIRERRDNAAGVHVGSRLHSSTDCVSADVIVSGERGAAFVAERVALPTIVGLVKRHLIRVGVRVRVRVGVRVRVRVRVRVSVLGLG